MMRNKRMILFCVVIFANLSCNYNNNKKENIKVNLKYINNSKSLFSRSIIPLYIVEDITGFTGIPNDLDYWRVFKIDKKKLHQFEDTNTTPSKVSQNTYVLSGKENANSVMIIDKNNNNDFSDDEKFTFKNHMALSRTEIANLSDTPKAPIYQVKGSLFKFQFFPFPNYFTSTKPELLINNELQIAFSPIGYWYGEFKTNGEFFKVALKRGLPKKKALVLFSKVKDSFSSIYNKDYLPYNKFDVVNLSGNNYTIDSINLSEGLLELKPNLDSNLIGLDKRLFIENTNLKLIDGSTTSVDNLIKEKDYLLLDFWGTWCAPCIELMPEVKKIVANYDNIQVLGVALDDNKEVVANFIKKNDINYPNHFISYAEVNKDYNEVNKGVNLISKQRISNYPYYILINNKRKIVYRGTGQEAIDKIKAIISPKNR